MSVSVCLYGCSLSARTSLKPRICCLLAVASCEGGTEPVGKGFVKIVDFEIALNCAISMSADKDCDAW